MCSTNRRLPALLVLVLVAAAGAGAQVATTGFAEDFALADDRAALLERLVPGTEDWYYYRCLERQHAGALADVPAILGAWVERHGRGDRVLEIENRQALLGFDADPEATWRYLVERLDLRFDDEPAVIGRKPDLPVALDQALIAKAALVRRALERHPGGLDGFQDRFLPELLASDLDLGLLRQLLNRLDRPDLPGLVAQVVRELDDQKSRGFGSLAVHGLLLLDQLEDCATRRPDLLGDRAFIDCYVAALRPGADDDWSVDVAVREAWLDRLEAFARRLGAAQNSFKAHVLHHRLRHDLELGRLDRARFLDYVRLPRRGAWVNEERLRDLKRGEELVDPSRSFASGLAPVGDDEALVRRCFEAIFGDEEALEPWLPFVARRWLERVLAETRILAGSAEKERWYSLLDDPAYYERLRERVEIEFAPTSRRHHRPEDPVALEVDLKNVPTLLVKIYEIDARAYYAEKGREIDASLEIEGLMPTIEKTLEHEDNPFLRRRRSIPLPELDRAGVWVVELIGNGLSSRAVVRKGRLQYQERRGSAGHVFRVLDDDGRRLADARILLGSREFAADETGEITIPYTTAPGRKAIVLLAGDRATLDGFDHLAEEYRLDAAIHVERESLLAESRARIVVRPSLLLNGRRVPIALLEEPVLVIRSADASGVASTLEIRQPAFADDAEFVQEIQVPAGLRWLRAEIRGRVRSITLAKDEDLVSDSPYFPLNLIDATLHTACPHLGLGENGWFVDLLGKSGEPIANRAVTVRLRHESFRDPVEIQLQTDERGRLHLGALEGIEQVMVRGVADDVGSWTLRGARRARPQRLHALASETLLVPYQGRADRVSRALASLIERRGGRSVRDCFEKLRLVAGRLEIRGLEPGDYELRLHETGESIAIAVTAGRRDGDWLVGAHRMLEATDLEPLDVGEARIAGEELVVRLRGVGPETRLHVVATRYLPPYDLFFDLMGPAAPVAVELELPRLESLYESGRRIADEYRYILERRFAKKFPGNMLDRPGLLLNPWAAAETQTAIGLGGGAGGAYGGRRGGARRSRARSGGSPGPSAPQPGVFANLDFLPAGARLLADLRPDAEGVVRLPLAELGEGQMIHVLAVAGEDAVYERLLRPERPLEPRDLRLARAFDSGAHLALGRDIEFVDRGARITIEDRGSGRLKVYDDLASVYRLYQSMGTGGADLDRFRFVLDWPKLTAEKKAELYSEHACHELHLFLKEKDPTFFAEVVKPYLASKAEKTFLDLYLLDGDLLPFLRPWAFERLNVVEKILLTRRLDGRAEGGRRHVRELFELAPPSPESLGVWFAAAIGADALGAEDDRNEFEKKAGEPVRSKEVPPGAPKPEGGVDRRADEDAPAEDAEAVESELMDKADEKAKSEVADRLAEERQNQAGELEELRRESLGKDLRARKQAVAHYRPPENTRRYVERNYWGRSRSGSGSEMIGVNEFWLDLARTQPGEPFRSTRFAQASGSFAEMMFALALLDLPFAAAEHEVKIDGKRLEITAGSPLLVLREELRTSRPEDEPSQILVSEAFYRVDDPWLFVGNERRDKYVTGEFLVDVAYGSRVVLTNPTSTPRKLELLVQVPEGAMPLENGRETASVPIALDAYGTTTHEYRFYFPRPGDSPHYPAHANRNGQLVAAAQPVVMKVVRELSEIDTESWEYVSQNGSPEQVIRHLEEANLLRLDLSRIAWRMKDRGFFERVLALLGGRHAHDDRLWSYALRHRDVARAREYLERRGDFLAACGPWLESALVTIDPVERLAYEQVDYAPLFNPRAHAFGKTREILNGDLAAQFARLMDILGRKPRLDDHDRMSVAAYLLLQDRVEEALAQFARIDPGQLATRIQYDYMRAYLDFFSTDHALARGIAERYVDHPVERWRKLFRNVLQQLDEAEGKAVAVIDEDDREQRQTAAASEEPALELLVEARRIELDYKNLTSCEIGFYEMDVEFLFSTSPFVKEGADATGWIRPNRTIRVELPADGKSFGMELPEEYRNSNLIVEARAGALRRRQTYFASSLTIELNENFGQLRVGDGRDGSPLPRVYVKVFAREPGGRVRFHKDGYTDIRGRFDYVSLSGPESATAERYALLVLSEDRGAVIKEVKAPTR